MDLKSKHAAVRAVAMIAWALVSGSSFAAQVKIDVQDTGAILETRDDGSNVVTFPTGTRFIRYPSGYGGELKPDGTVVGEPMPKVQILPGGAVIQTLENGTKIEALPEGTRVLRWPDKSGFTRYADGSGHRDFPDGSMAPTEGTVQIKPDGTAIEETDWGYDLFRVEYTPDGRQNESSWWYGQTWQGTRQKFTSAQEYQKYMTPETPAYLQIRIADLLQKSDVFNAGTPNPAPGAQPAQGAQAPIYVNPGAGYGTREPWGIQGGVSISPESPPLNVPPAESLQWTIPPLGIPGAFRTDSPPKKGTPWQHPPSKK